MLTGVLAAAASGIDSVSIDFNESQLWILNGVIAFIMLGIAMDTKVSDFKVVTQMPRAMAVGIAAQFICLPAITYGLTLILDPRPSIALGMILVACCPPGAISNVLTYRANGNVALSVSMTAISNLIAIVLMPINFAFWGNLHPEASEIFTEVDIDALEMLADIVLIIGIPFLVGILLANRRPGLVKKVHPWVRRLSLIALVLFIVAALIGNFEYFIDYIGVVLLAVLLHDALALSLGYGLATATGLDEYNRRPVTFEVGIRNVGIGLGIIFSFFDGLGGMAIVAGFWGVWDIVAGLILASLWARRPTGHRQPGATEGEV